MEKRLEQTHHQAASLLRLFLASIPTRASTLSRRDLNEIRELLFRQRRRCKFEIDGIVHDHVEPDDLVGVQRRLRIKLISDSLRLRQSGGYLENPG